MKRTQDKVKNIFGIESKSAPAVPAETPKAQMIELRKILLNARGSEIVEKVISAALDDEHPAQVAAMKMCMDRLLPMAEFEKNGSGSRPTVTINISGIKDDKLVIDGGEIE